MLKLDLDNIKSFIFSGGEIHVQLDTELDYLKDGCELTCHIDSPEKQIKLIMVLNALGELVENGLQFVKLIIPYLPYARQDRTCSKGQAFALKAFIRILEPYNWLVYEIEMLDVHSQVAINLLQECLPKTPIKNIELADKIGSKSFENIDFVIAPDTGAFERVTKVATKLNKVLICATKERDPSTGNITNYQIQEGILEGKRVLVIDDICDGGKTFELLGEKLKNEKVKEAHLLVSHGIFSKGFDELDKYYNSVQCINPFKLQEGKRVYSPL
jgi:ribose-phosphate pyrophosphokinase